MHKHYPHNLRGIIILNIIHRILLNGIVYIVTLLKPKCNLMSSLPDDDPIKRSSSEKYDRVGASLRWSQILAAASSIFFGFLLKIAVNPPSYFQLFDNIILLAALYAVTTATAMFIMPVVYHMMHYRKFDVDKYLLTTKKYTLIGIICIMLAMYLGLGLSMNSKLQTEIAYGLASLPFIIIFVRFYRYSPTDIIEGTSTEDYDRVGAGMRWSQILAAASSIFFGFLLNIAVNPPSYFQLFDNIDSLSGTLRSGCGNSYVYYACYSSLDSLS